MSCLTPNDAFVLQALFDDSSITTTTTFIDPSLPAYPIIPAAQLSDLQSRELQIIHSLSSTNTATDENEPTIHRAISDLDAIIATNPTYASAYVNRAQALRMLIDPSTSEMMDPLFTAKNASLTSRILADLTRAISLAAPPSPVTDPVSATQARVLADAHTHRGYLFLRASRNRRTVDGGGEEEEGLGRIGLESLGAADLEEMASREFFLAGRYGSPVARQMAVRTNPYAKMCGAIVREAMRERS